MRGDLTQDSLPEILRTIYKQRKSGSLRLVQGQTRREIFFELGAMIFASSNRKEDRIGETMLRHGFLSQDDYQRVQSHMGRGKRFGKVLIDLGIMTERELIMNVTIQILDIIYSVFEWTTGTYEFTEVEKSVSDDLKLDLSTASIILEGVRRIKDLSVIERGMGDLNRLIGPSTNPLMRLQTLNLKPLERQIIELTTRPVGLLTLLTSVKMPAEAVLRAVYGLLSAGVLDHYPAAKVSRLSGRLELPAELKEQISAPEPVVKRKSTGSLRFDEMAIRRRLLPIIENIASGNVYALLGVQPGVTLEELQAKYFKLARELHPDRFLNASIELRTDIEEIFQRISEGYESIRQDITAPATEEEYFNTASANKVKTDVIPTVEEELDTAASISTQAETRPLRNADLPITEEVKKEEDTTKEGDITEAVTRQLLEDPSARILEAVDPLSDTAEDEALDESSVSAAQEETSEVAIEIPVQPPPPQHAPPQPPPELSRAEELFMKGRAYFQARDIPNSVKALRNAVRLNQNEPRYLLLLGHVLSSHQKWQKEAEEQFKHVLQIDPQNAMAHVGLGQLYSKIGLTRRAEAEFREALKLDPENQVARKGLQALDKETGRGDSSGFISLFGRR